MGHRQDGPRLTTTVQRVDEPAALLMCWFLFIASISTFFWICVRG